MRRSTIHPRGTAADASRKFSPRASTRWRGVAALSVAAALALTACTTSGSGNADNAPTKKVSTSITSDDVTLTLAYVDDPPTKALISGFTDKHPNVTIKEQQIPFSDYVKSIKLSMASDSAPDLAEYNPGAMRSLIPAGLILNLDDYEKAYGWGDTFPASSLEVLTSDEKAKTYGSGSLYAVPGALSVLGVFYNKDILAKAGISNPPTTVDEFAADLAKVKSGGVTPLSLGGLQVGGFQLWNALVNVLGNVQDYKDWVYGKTGATIKTDGATKATQDVVDWVKQGYIASGASATSDSDAQANFVAGKNAFLVTGNWAAAALEKSMGDNVGFFPMPGTSADAPKVASGGSVAFSISAKSKYPNVAAAFLDYLGSADAAQVEYAGGFMPVNTSADIDTKGLRGEIATSFSEIIDGAGIVPFPDYASPGMIDKLTAGVQGIITGHMTSDQFLDSLQGEWTEYHG